MDTIESTLSKELVIPCKPLGDKRWGAKPVNVTLGGGLVPGPNYAVCCIADDGKMKKWISTREDCLLKLQEWGLHADAAELLIELGDQLDKLKTAGPPLAEQEAQGLYDEEVQKMRDGILEDIKAGNLKSRAAVRERVVRACALSLYGTDHQFASVAIRFTNAYVAEALALSRHIMYDDTMARLLLEKDYKKLPERQ